MISLRRLLIVRQHLRSLSSATHDSDSKYRLFENQFIPPEKESLPEYLKTFNLFHHIFEPWAKKQPNHPALWMTDGKSSEVLTYSETLEQSHQLASALCFNDVTSPKCSIVILPKIIPWWIINLSGSICEMAISPGTLMLTEKEILYRLEKSQADALFCGPSLMEKIDEHTRHLFWKVVVDENMENELINIREGWHSFHQLLNEGKMKGKIVTKDTTDGESIAQLFFTSGTTGNPKMVTHSQAGLGLAHFPITREWLNLQPEDVFWNLSDLGWVKAAYSSLYSPLIAGSTIFAHQMPRFDSKTVLKTLEKEPITVVCFPPTAYRALVQEDLSTFKPKSLRHCVSAGEPLNEEVLKIWHKHTGMWIHEGYGQTEGTVMCCSPVGIKTKPNTMGKPVVGYDMQIIDEQFRELPPNKEGQLAVSLKNGWPYGLFKGYTMNSEQNRKVFQNGFYLTGDRAYVDDEGYFCYVGRDDDIIISAGYRIGPFEVESALLEHPSVSESAVVASPDKERGHVVKAFIVLSAEYKDKTKSEQDTSALAKEIQDFVKKTTSPYKYPRKIEFVDSLPKTISGKIRRSDLRRRETNAL